MTDIQQLSDLITAQAAAFEVIPIIAQGELTVEVPFRYLSEFCLMLRDHPDFDFKQLIDLCGVVYLHYGLAEWATESTTANGFSRGVEQKWVNDKVKWQKPRFAVVYHLLSLKLNHRIRVRTFAQGEPPLLPSVVGVWEVANWFEREVFDLYGILFEGHPDLRRILTDYGFIGHPFRKDFPLIGTVEPRYDAKEGRVIYEAVSIKPRVLVPKVIRKDNRSLDFDETNQPVGPS